MASISLNAIDMNLLLALEALLEERNVTRAAARVGLSQPAMSAALARLRAVFGDPLLVRVGGGMSPTHRARQLAVPLADAMARLRVAIDDAPAFDPRASSRSFHIATSDYGEAIVLPAVAQALLEHAPAVSLQLTRTGFLFQPPQQALDAGELDFALGFFEEPMPIGSSLLVQSLFDDRLVCVVRKRHPRIHHRLSLRAFLDVPQIRVIYPLGGESAGTIDLILRGRGLKRTVALTVSHFLSVPHLAASSDLIGIVPERLARLAVKSLPIRIFTPPVPLPSLAVTLVWHERRQYDPGHRWIRELIATTRSR